MKRFASKMLMATFFMILSPHAFASRIAAGRDHTCAVMEQHSARTDGDRTFPRILCFGDNHGYQLGREGDGGPQPRDTALPTSEDILPLGQAIHVSRITAGVAHSCALISGRAYCWGRMGRAMVKLPTLIRTMSGPLTGLVSIESGGSHACGSTGSALYCWGDNTYGQLGNGSREPVTALMARPVGDLSGTIEMLSLGLQHSCAVLRGGDAYCWGSNRTGQLGVADENLLSSASPLRVSIPSSPRSLWIVSGDHHTCVTDGERQWCWGDNHEGQLALSSDEDLFRQPQPNPIAVHVPRENWFYMASGDLTCFSRLFGDHQMTCWGNLESSLLPRDAQEVYYSSGTDAPGWIAYHFTVPGVRSGDDTLSLSMGSRHACVASSLGFSCWGDPGHGRTGDGSFGMM